MRIPLCPLPVRRAKHASRIFLGLAQRLSKIFPSLELELKQAEFEMSAREYLSIALFSAFFMLFVVFFLLLIITAQFLGAMQGFLTSLSLGFLFFFITILYIRMYPKLYISRKITGLERNLLDALRHLYVQIKSGVSLFDAMVSISNANYGMVSKEFSDATKSINSGVPVENALEDLAVRNPSTYFRRAVWQLSNGMKAGSDIGIVLKEIIHNLSNEQRIMIKRYGSQLNPMTLVYMMVAIIMPSLGITLIIVLSSFSGFVISETIFWIILIFVAFFQFMFIGMIKSRRPKILGA